MSFTPPLCQVLINTGSGPNDGSGDSIRDAFVKVNAGFQALYTGTGPSGPSGPCGPSGPSGPQGVQGNQGFQGLTGVQGFQGYQGCQGPIGYQGHQGPYGTQGAQGIAGYQGAAGCSGSHGTNGAQGHQGFQGAGGTNGGTGAQGAAGPIGGCAGNILFNCGGSATRGFGSWDGSTMNVPGSIVATGNITAYCTSDIKFKENISDIKNALSSVNAIGGKLYDWSDDYIENQGGQDGYFVQKNDFGVIAQDVLAAFPLAVRTRPNGTLAVDYKKLVALAFAAINELTERVNQLESKKEE